MKEVKTIPSNLKLGYCYGSEAAQYSFYRILKEMFTAPHKGASIDAKCLWWLALPEDPEVTE